MGEIITSLPPSVSYSVLTVLAIFLAGTLVVQRERDKRASRRQDKSDEFIQDLVKSAMEAQAANIETMRQLTAESAAREAEGVAAMQEVARRMEETTGTMAQVATKLASHEERAMERHLQIMSERGRVGGGGMDG